jgi:heterodisulfide reductase subunit C
MVRSRSGLDIILLTGRGVDEHKGVVVMINGLSGQFLSEGMRTASLGPTEDPVSGAEELGRCHQCGQCAGVCPSQRQGGIRPADTMVRLRLSLVKADERELWLCTMCNSCTERCQLGVSPSERIQELRRLSTSQGHCPKAFLEEAKLFIRTGLSFPNSGLTKKVRKELRLPDLVVEQSTVDEIGHIVQATDLGRVPLDR